MLPSQTVLSMVMDCSRTGPTLVAAATGQAVFDSPQASYSGNASCNTEANVSLAWHPPAQYEVNSLSSAINGSGVYGFIFDSSKGPHNTYNWCNMPHTNVETYLMASDDYKLEYVEVIHRHHKRTPYASNTFPKENYGWDCSDEGLFYSGKPLNPYGNHAASTYWLVTTGSNPLEPQGFSGTCQFPQITRGGLDDSYQHGADLKAVYHDMLKFIPDDYDSEAVSYRVTNNVITSQVASMVIAGMYPSRAEKDTPLLVQPVSIDSLEPAYKCSTASTLFSSYGPGSTSLSWLRHLDASASLFARLDLLSGIGSSGELADWHASWDHYFDNLSARLCHEKPLPCSKQETNDCVTQAEAEAVFRLGEYEYSFIYRDSWQSLPASVRSYGVWVAELATNLRAAMGLDPSTRSSVRYRHNVAHDGSISRLLSILQLDKMVWPGMGAEVVFELYSKLGRYYLRVLWGGQILHSSHPAFGSFDMVPIEKFLAYVDGLVGIGASKFPDICIA